MSHVLILGGLLLAMGIVILASKKSHVWCTMLGIAVALVFFGWGLSSELSGFPSREPVPTGNHQVIAAGQEAGKWYLVVSTSTKRKDQQVRLYALPQKVVEEQPGPEKKLVVVREGGMSRVTLFLPETPAEK